MSAQLVRPHIQQDEDRDIERKGESQKQLADNLPQRRKQGRPKPVGKGRGACDEIATLKKAAKRRVCDENAKPYHLGRGKAGR